MNTFCQFRQWQFVIVEFSCVRSTRSRAPWVRKLGYLCIQEILVLTKSSATRTIIFQRKNLNYLIVCFTQCTLFVKKFVLIADLFAVHYLWVVCKRS